MKNLKQLTLLLFIVYLNIGNADPEKIDITIGDWDYGNNRCGVWEYGFEDTAEAEESGIQRFYPDECLPSNKIGDDGFPPEDYPNTEQRWGCGFLANYPKYNNNLELAYLNHKGIDVEYYRQSGDQCLRYTDGLFIRKQRFIGCEEGWVQGWDSELNKYMCFIAHDAKNDGDQCGTNAGNPVNTATGNKFHNESIDLFNDLFDMSFYYNSSRATASNANLSSLLGRAWLHTYSKSISKGIILDNGVESVFVNQSDGRSLYFQKINGSWQSQSLSSAVLQRINDEWVLETKQGLTETYSTYGRLIKVKEDGREINVSYENDKISALTADDGSSIQFVFLGPFINKLIDQNGNEWLIAYNAHNMLSTITYPDSTVKTFHYEDSNPYLMTGITDRRNKRFATYEYDSQHRVVKEWHLAKDLNGTDIKVEELSIVYHNDNTRTITNSRGKVSTYEVENNNGLWQIKNIIGPGCSSCSNDNSSFEYDPLTNDLLSKTVDGVTTKYFNYDNKGQYAYKIEAFGTVDSRRTDYTYDSRFIGKVKNISEPSISDINNKVTNYTYNDNGQVTSMTEFGYMPNNVSITKITSYEYAGPFNQISKRTDPMGRETTYKYYPDTNPIPERRNRLKRITGPDGIFNRKDIRWSSTGKITEEKRPNGIIITNNYDALNDRLVSTTQSDGVKSITTQFTYLATGQIKSMTQNYGTPEATTMTLTYDDALRVTRVTDQRGNYIEYELDTEGNQLGERTYDPNDVLKKQITQAFDEYDLIDSVTQSGVITDYNYGSNGVLNGQVNGNNITTEYSYDNLKRLSQINQDYQGTSPNTVNTITGFEYDEGERVKKVTDARGNFTTYNYDDFGNLLSLVSPDTGTTNYVYDLVGNMINKTDAKGIKVHMTYDSRNRLTSIDYADNTLDTTFVYDQGVNGTGRLSSFIDQSGTTNYTYDSFGKLLDKTQVVTSVANRSISYVYDANNRVSSMTYPSGMTLSYEYDNLNQIVGISTVIDGQNKSIVSKVGYLPFGPIRAINFGNGKNYIANYDDGYRLIDYSYGVDISAAYTYDNNHNITGITRETAVNHDHFAYDNLGRLTYDSHNSTTLNYDKLGNRISKQEGNQTPSLYNIDANSNKLLSIDSYKPREYDANGNTLETKETGNNFFTYNQANRMKTYGNGRSIIASYQHNAIGQRVLKKVGSDDYVFIYDEQGQLIHESKYGPLPFSLAKVHLWDRSTIWLDNRPIARVETNYSGANITSQEIYYIQTDHLNTPRWVTDDSGLRIWSWESDAFGTTAANEDVDGDGNSFNFNMRFPGQYFDAESGIYYNYFRDYEPETGRYIQSDPIGLGAGPNTFSYTESSPIYHSDMFGLMTSSTCFWDSTEETPWTTLRSRKPTYTLYLVTFSELFGPFGHCWWSKKTILDQGRKVRENSLCRVCTSSSSCDDNSEVCELKRVEGEWKRELRIETERKTITTRAIRWYNGTNRDIGHCKNPKDWSDYFFRI